jgi:hypothetical protein
MAFGKRAPCAPNLPWPRSSRASYKLFDINRPKLERMIHGVLDAVRFDTAIPDRFGNPVRPREWFMVPLPIVDEIVERIGDGTIVGMRYDPATASLTHS